MADRHFSFWENMQETIEKYSDPVFKYKCYDALVEYGLYRTLPEDDGTIESQALISLCQSFTNSLETNWNFSDKKSNEGQKGGSNQTYSNEELKEAIKYAARKKNGIPTLIECVEGYKEVYDKPNSKISGKTFSRRYSTEERGCISEEALKKIESEEKSNGWTF